MGLFDVFDPQPAKKLANQGYSRELAANNAAQGALTGNTASANALLDTGANNATDQLSQGFGPAQGYYDKALQLYQLTQPTDLAAYGLRADALGVNGQDAANKARLSFQASPGYQWQVDQSNQNILRNQAATGGVLSGNTGIALSDRAGQLANQDWQQWLNNLGTFDPHNDISAETGILGNQAALTSGTAAAKAAIQGNLGSSKANNLMTLGQQIAAEQNQRGQYGYQNSQDINGANQTAGQNTWGAILGLLGGGLGAAGQAGGFGKLFS